MEQPQATHPAAGPLEQPGVFLIHCYKCLRSYELHGKESILTACLLDEGWVRTPKGMICPWCPAASASIERNRTREIERRARRAA